MAAVEEVGLPVNAVMGTSAGALSGSLYCAGYAPEEVRRCGQCRARGRGVWPGGQLHSGTNALVPLSMSTLRGPAASEREGARGWE